MQPTAFGLVVLPLSLIFANQPVRLLQLALVASVFEGAAFAVVGGESGLGLPPATAPAVLFLAHIGLQYMLGMRYPGEGIVLRVMMPLLLLLVYALATAVLLPDFFANQVVIWPQKLEFFDQGAIPLRPDGSNASQCIYFLLNIMIASFGGFYLTRGGINFRGIVRVYLACGYLVVLLAVWQLASRVAGVPFPNDFLYSNPGWLILGEQTLGGLPRINGPFSEPAALATYLSGMCFCCLWLCVRGHRIMAPRLLLALSILTIFLSTSTTGIVVVTVGLPLVLVFAVGRGDRKGVREAGNTLLGLLIGGIILLGPAVALHPELLDMLGTIIQGTLEKGDSQSFSERTTADTDALLAALQTFGLGVGWGAFRSSSLIPGLLANGGLPGVGLVTLFVVRLVRLMKRGAARVPHHPGRIVIDGFGAALLGQIAAAVVAAPTITSMTFFLQLACVVGVTARIMVETQTVTLLEQRRPQYAATNWSTESFVP